MKRTAAAAIFVLMLLQYRVAPGDVIKVEKTGTGVDSVVEFNEVLAVSPADGQITKATGATVTGEVVQEDRCVFDQQRPAAPRIRYPSDPWCKQRDHELALQHRNLMA
jgi:hypothetical protein